MSQIIPCLKSFSGQLILPVQLHALINNSLSVEHLMSTVFSLIIPRSQQIPSFELFSGQLSLPVQLYTLIATPIIPSLWDMHMVLYIL